MAGDDVKVRVGAEGAEQVDSTFKQVSASVRRLGNAASDATKQMERDVARFSNKMAEIGKKLAAFGAVTQGALAVGVKAAADFETQLADIGKTAGASTAQLQGISKQILAMSDRTRTNQGPAQLAAGIQDLVAQGLKLDAAVKSIEAVGRVATATGSEITAVTKTAFQLQNALKIDASELTATFDALAFAGKAGAFELKDMAEFMPTLASAAGSLGIKGREGAVSLAAMIQMVRKDAPDAAQAATRLTDAMMKMTSPAAVENFAKFGVDIERVMKDARRNGLNPMEEALKALQRVTGGDTFRLGEIFGDKEAKQALTSLMRYREEYEKLRDEAGGSKAAGTVDADFLKSIDTFNERWKSLLNSLQRLGIVVGNALMPAVKQVSDVVERLFASFNKLPASTQENIAKFAALAATVATVAGAFLMFAPQIVALKTLFSGGALASAITGITGALSGLALPITAAIAAVALLVTAWRNNWGNIQEHTQTAIAAVQRFIVDGFETVRAVAVPLWNKIWTTVTSTFNAVVEELRPAVQAVGNFIGTTWNDIAAITKAAWDTLSPVVSFALNAIRAAVEVWIEVIKSRWEMIWNVIKGVVSTVWPAVSGTVSAGLAVIRGVVETVMALLQGDWKKAWDAVQRGAGDAWARLSSGWKTALNNMLDTVKNLASSFFNAGTSIAQAFYDGIRSLDGHEIHGVREKLGGKDFATAQADNAIADKNMRALIANLEKQGFSGLWQRFQGLMGGGPAPSRPVGGGENGPDVAPPPGKMTAAQLYAFNQRKFVNDALKFNGAQWSAEDCQKFVWAVIQKGGFTAGGASRTPMDLGLLGPGDKPGAGYADALYAKDKLARFSTDLSTARLGDLAFFTQTYGNWMKGVVTHVGIVTRTAEQGGVRIMDVAGRAGYKSIERDISEFAPHQILGVGTPKFLGAKGGGGFDGATQMYKDLALLYNAAAGPGPALNEFDKQRDSINQRYRNLEAASVRQGAPDSMNEKFATDWAAELQRIDDLETAAREKRLHAQNKEKADRWATLQETKKWDQEDAEQRYQAKLTEIDSLRALNQITDEEALLRRATELDATNLHGTALMEAKVGFGQQYQEYLTQQQELQGTQYVAWLQQQETQLQQLATTSTAAQVQLGLVRQALHQQERQRWEQMREQVTQIADAIGSHFQSFLENVMSGTKSFGDSFKELWKNVASTVIAEISRMIAKMLAMWAVQKALGFFAGLLFPPVATSFLPGVGATLPLAHTGGLVVPGGIQAFHTGGMVGDLPGLRSDEVLAKLQVGEMVLSRSMVQSLGSGAGAGEQPGMAGGLRDVKIVIEHFEAHHTSDVHGLARELGQMILYETQGARG